jgi:hypothetical protein
MNLYNNADNTYKIAVCFSGQPRYWKECEKNIKRFFEFDDLNIQTDYFIHTWDTNTWRFPKTPHPIHRNEKHNDKEKIIECYRPKGFVQEEFNESKFLNSRPWDPLFYSFAQSLMLKRRYELSKDFEYDLVIKARLDVIYDPSNKFPWYPKPNPGFCYTTYINKFPAEFCGNNFNDVIFYGDSPTMDLISDLYASHACFRTESYLQKNEHDVNINREILLGPGCMLWNYMTKLSINPTVCTNPFEYLVMRSTAVVDNLDCIDDYNAIREKSHEWY